MIFLKRLASTILRYVLLHLLSIAIVHVSVYLFALLLLQVSVLSLDPTGESNWTTVTFGVWPYPSNFTLSPTELSILRSSLVSLVIRQSILYLTPSLFGNSSSFEILRFPGGITIIPPQTAFVPQKPDGLFNFSLNFPIDVVQDKLSELKAQMKSGLFLNEHEVCATRVLILFVKSVTDESCGYWRYISIKVSWSFKISFIGEYRFDAYLAMLLAYMVHERAENQYLSHYKAVAI